MNLDPKVSWWLNFVLFALTSATGLAWNQYLDAKTAALVMMGIGYVSMLLNFAIHGSVPGLQSQVSAVAKAAVGAAVVIGGLFFATPSHATGLKPLSLLAPKAAVVAPAAAPVDSLTKALNALAKISQDVVTGVVADIGAADVDAATLTNPSDPESYRDAVAHACYPNLSKFILSLPVATPTTGKLVGFQLFQKKRDFVIQLQAGLPSYLKIGCGALLGDEASIFTKALAMVGVTVAGGALLPGLPAIALPALGAL